MKRRRPHEERRRRGDEQQRHEVDDPLEVVDRLEALLERHGQQEAEEHLHAGHDDPQLVEQLDQLAVEPLGFVFVGARAAL